MKSLFYETVQYYPDLTGRSLQLPCLVNEYNEVVTPVLNYAVYLIGEGYSQSHLKKVRAAICLFFEYSIANPPGQGFGLGEKGVVNHWTHFSAFRDAVVSGTFDTTTGRDPAGLCWNATSVGKGKEVATLLTDFFKYCDELGGGTGASTFNPKISPSSYAEFSKAAAYEFRRSKAMLGHTWVTAASKKYEAHAVEGTDGKSNSNMNMNRILDCDFLRVLEHGFNLDSCNGLRDALIAILMNKGGLRISEALHLWIVDIFEDPVNPGYASVQVVHPDEGGCDLTASGRRYTKRKDYLRYVYCLEPRTLLPSKDAQALGWKSKYSNLPVYWFDPYWGKIFWRLWKRYLKKTATNRDSSPYAFIAQSKNQWRPLSEGSYRKAFERAVYSAGLVPPGGCDMKALGLTPHGCRHAYGDRAKNGGKLDAKVVMTMMHHSSPGSQEVYTRKSHAQVVSEIKRAVDELRSERPLADAQLTVEPSLSKALKEAILE